MMRHDPADPEVALRRPSLDDQLAGTMFERPALPTARARADVKYALWRLTEDGKRAYDWIERKALALAAGGERRIGAKSLVERARDELHVHVNNLLTPCLARELVLRHPHLADHIELRERNAA